MSTIKERVVKCIVYRFPHDTIEMETKFKDDLGIDSLGMLELVMDLEDEFGVNISMDKIDSVATVADVVRMFTDWSDGVIDNAE